MFLEELNDRIRGEADFILNELGLMDILARYGKPYVHGSYVLGLMTWRDLDLHLETDDMSESEFFELGKAIVAGLKPSRMSYRYERDGKTAHLPIGLYWGTYIDLFGQTWKIDLWAIDAEQRRQKQEAFARLQVGVDDTNRAAILALKNELHLHPDYRKRFFSVDIYEAVFDGATSKEQFSNWLEKQRGLSYRF